MPLCWYILADCYLNGYGIEKDTVKAVRLYKKAAKRGVEYAQFCLGECYYYGRGVKVNIKRAKKWFKKAAKKEYAPAQYHVGLYHSNGNPRYSKKAEKYYRLAAEQGYSEAQYTLAAYLKQFYNETKTSREEIASFFKKAAEKDHHDAQYALAVCYINGYGVLKNKDTAVKWLQKATLGGHKQKLSQCLLGVLKNSAGIDSISARKAFEELQTTKNSNPPVLKKDAAVILEKPCKKKVTMKKENTLPYKVFPVNAKLEQSAIKAVNIRRYKKLCTNPKTITKKQLKILKFACDSIDTVRTGLYVIGDRCYKLISE